MRVSLCMIVKDEAEVLARCLESARPVADEIVVVDTGSSDRTREIACSHTDLVFDFPWRDDFAAARNFAFSKGSGDYLFWLDADDVVPPESRKLLPALRELLKTGPDAVFCPYDLFSQTAEGEPSEPALTFYRARFLKRSAGPKWVGRVHECIPPRGKTERFDFRVRHLGSKKERGTRNLDLYRKWAAEEPLSPRDKFYYGRELYYHRLYAEAAALLEEAIDDGWYVNRIEACKVLSLCRLAQKRNEEAKAALLRSFLFGEPRASVCCELGRQFWTEEKLREAVFWYKAALSCRDHSPEGDFDEPACRGLLPALQLVCCLYRLGEKDEAARFHKKTEELAPTHPSVLFNKQFFD